MARVVLEKVYKSFPSRQVQKDGAESTRQSKSGSVAVLRGINFSIEDGEFLVLVGPSGCGKSTLLRSIAGLEEVTGGSIYVGDREVTGLPPKERNIAMVFQNYALYPHLTVYDNLAFGLRRMGWEEKQGRDSLGEPSSDFFRQYLLPWGEKFAVAMTRSLPQGLRYLSATEKFADERVRSVAKLLQIEALLHRYPKQLSGGQKQRVALGRAISRNPQVFLMDEPLSNLDAKLRAETRSQIVQLQKQLQTTTLYVTHDQTEAMTMGDRIAVINQGEIQQIARPLELYNHPANRFVAEFIGSPPMNFLSVQFKAPLLVTHDQFRLTLPEVWEESLLPYDGQSLWLGIRPEHLSLSPPATKNLAVTVDIVEALGNDTYLGVHLSADSNTLLQVRIQPDFIVEVGDELWLSMNLEKIHLFDPQTGQAIQPHSPL